MRAMKPLFLVLVGLVAFGAERPAQTTCATESHNCTSGSCSRPIPDGGQPALADGGGPTVMPDAGIQLAFVQGYTVSVCGTAARPLAGAGTLQDHHCKLGSCARVDANTQTVTLVGTAATPCQEFPEFVLHAALPSTDRMVWASSGVTISNWDGGAADKISVIVCPTN